MAALGRLDDLEEFVLGIQPQDAFRPRAVWQFPGGLHDYTLPSTVADRIGSPEELGVAARSRRDRARRLRDRRERLPGGRRSTRLRARVLVACDRAGRDGPRDSRVGGDQRARASDPARRPDRDGRRLGAELPVRARVPQSRRRRDRSVPLRRELPTDRPGVPRAHAGAARALSGGAAGASPPRGGAPRAGALVARRAGALRRAHRASHARRVRSQRGGRGADRTRTRYVGPGAPSSPGGRDGCGCRSGGAMAPPTPTSRARSPLRGGALPVPSRPARPRCDRARNSGLCRPRPDLQERQPVARPSSSWPSSSAGMPSPTKP